MIKLTLGLLWWLSYKESACNAEDARDVSLSPGSERSSDGVCSNLLQYSCLENRIDREACWTIQSKGLQEVGNDWNHWAQKLTLRSSRQCLYDFCRYFRLHSFRSFWIFSLIDFPPLVLCFWANLRQDAWGKCHAIPSNFALGHFHTPNCHANLHFCHWPGIFDLTLLAKSPRAGFWNPEDNPLLNYSCCQHCLLKHWGQNLYGIQFI